MERHERYSKKQLWEAFKHQEKINKMYERMLKKDADKLRQRNKQIKHLKEAIIELHEKNALLTERNTVLEELANTR